MAPGTEFARDFSAGIGSLQLDVVLVSLFIFSWLGFTSMILYWVHQNWSWWLIYKKDSLLIRIVNKTTVRHII